MGFALRGGMMNYLDLPDLPEKISSRIMPITESGCWIWMGAVSIGGYGRVRWLKQDTYIHLVTYSLFVGPLDPCLDVDHQCRVRPCCNPYHLEQVTHLENTLNSSSFVALNKCKTHCPQGHPYAGSNLHTHLNGYRRCKKCRYETLKRFKINNPTYFRDYQRMVYKTKNGGWDGEYV